MQIETGGILPDIPEIQAEENVSPAEVGISVDVGTTTLVVKVWNISDRRCLATVAEKNKQIRYGTDVVRRISYASRNASIGSNQNAEPGSVVLHYAIITQLEELFKKALSVAANGLPRGIRPSVSMIVITGNTVMLSFVCAVSVDGLASAPFVPESLFDFTIPWDDVRAGRCGARGKSLGTPSAEYLEVFRSSVIPPVTPVYFPPCIGPFIGADTVCAMIAAGFPIPGEPADLKPWEAPIKAPRLLADIGTNSELALYIPDEEGKPGKILCTSGAAGPAFEAANISCGMSAVKGAIEDVSCVNDKISCKIIGGTEARGICGSGLVSAVAAFLRCGWIDSQGVIRKGSSELGDGMPCIQLTPAVYISQQDVRNLQLAKSAVRTGLLYMMEKSPTLPVFCLAGGFGSRLNIGNAERIGLIPKELHNRCVQLGNGALAGASALLFSATLRKKATALASHSYQMNMAAIPGFQSRFLSSIDFL